MPKIYEKIVFHLPTGGLACSDGRAIALQALPWRHPWLEPIKFTHITGTTLANLDKTHSIVFCRLGTTQISNIFQKIINSQEWTLKILCRPD